MAIDLSRALSGEGIPSPDLLARDDGICLLYRGRTHWFTGEPESLKSWAAQHACAQALKAGGVVLILDYEAGIVERFRALGVTDDVIADRSRLMYVRPEESLADRYAKPTEFAFEYWDLLAHRPDIVVIDGVTEAMTVEGLDLRDNADVAAFMRRLLRPAAASEAAVVALDHRPKAKDDRGSWAIGGQHKRAGVTGAAFTFEVVGPLRGGGQGRVKIEDRQGPTGHVRAHAIAGRVRDDGPAELPRWWRVRASQAPDSERDAPASGLVARIEEHLTIYPGGSKTSASLISATPTRSTSASSG